MAFESKLKKDHKGFSLVEVIIVIAIVAILAGASVSMYGYLRYANMQAAVESVQNMLEKQRITAMTKEGTWYLYIYKLSDGYYMKLDNNMCVDADHIQDKEDGTKICGNNIEISCSSGSQVFQVAGSTVIRVVYSRSGIFFTGTDGTNAFFGNEQEARILFSGSGDHNVTLYRETGKSFVDEP